jgi:hypothetical protein
MAKKAKGPTAYTAPHDVYVSGIYTKAGDVFVTDADPADEWVALDPDETAAIQASTNDIPKALITAIKAANEPRL